MVLGEVGVFEGLLCCGSPVWVHTQQLVEEVNSLGVSTEEEHIEVLLGVECEGGQVALGLEWNGDTQVSWNGVPCHYCMLNS